MIFLQQSRLKSNNTTRIQWLQLSKLFRRLSGLRKNQQNQQLSNALFVWIP